MKRLWLIVPRLGRASVAATALLMIALLSSGPVLADTNLSTSGVVGAHSLVDTPSKAGVTCSYNAIHDAGYYYEALLKYLDVRPPRMRAASGTQAVAWRFVVLRTRLPHKGAATTKKTYTSPWQTGVATTTKNAKFRNMGVNVIVPRDGRKGDVYYEYMVNVEMDWFQPGGPATGISVHRIDYDRTVLNGFPLGTAVAIYLAPCDGWTGMES